MPQKLMMEDFTDTVWVIDDNKDEALELIKQLHDNDIAAEYLSVEGFEGKSFKKLRRLIFLDLKLDDSRSTVDNIAKIRKLLSDKFPSSMRGVYGIVLWTKHLDDIEQFKEKISQDSMERRYNVPLFIVGLDKTKYIEHGYADLFADLEDVIRRDKAAYFFINWSVSVGAAAETSVKDIYSLVPDYSKQETELQYLFYKLAQNHTGLPEKFLIDNTTYDLTTDAYKAFDELLYSDLINKQSVTEASLFGGFPIANPWKDNFGKAIQVFARVNSKSFIDTVNIDQTLIVPGNVYELNGIKPPVTCSFPKDGNKIMIELTPPCDFSQKKKIYSRGVYGFIIDCPLESGELDKKLNDLRGQFRYFLWPIEWQGEARIMCFDFRCLVSLSDSDIIDGSRYKVVFKANPKLLADILQKFSSHAARLGVSNIRPD